MLERLQKTLFEMFTRAQKIGMTIVMKLVRKKLVRTCKKQLLELKF